MVDLYIPLIRTTMQQHAHQHNMHAELDCDMNSLIYVLNIYDSEDTLWHAHTMPHACMCKCTCIPWSLYACRGIMVTYVCFTFCSILTECSEIQCQIINRNNRDVVKKKCNLYNTFIFPNGRKLLTESNCSYILHIEYIYLLQYLWSLLTMKMHLLSVSMMTMLASEERLFGGKYVGNWSSNEQLLQIET